jgi:hypothetical protein
MRSYWAFAGIAVSLGAMSAAQAATTVLFVGNSFTYGDRPGAPLSSVSSYKSSTVTDLNGLGLGGVPAIFKDFTVQAGLDYAVSLETIGGYTLGDHYTRKRALIDRSWNAVVLQSQSVLDPANPGNPATLITQVDLLADMFVARNPAVDIYLTATWSRADLTYVGPSPWFGKPISAMAEDIQSGYEQAAAASPQVTDVVELGRAWNDAMESGLADPNPYDGISPGKINLWASDSFHASPYGSYLSALMHFGAITGVDPRMLGARESAAVFFGFTPDETTQLQTIAYNRLFASTAPPGVPEPQSWAMMIVGFGMIGGLMRRQQVQLSNN